MSLPSVSPSSSAWHGQLQLTFDRPDQKTLLSRSYNQAPLKIQRPFYPEGDLCHSVMLHTAGGIVGGDRLSVQTHLHSHAQALVTTAAAAKIYDSNGKTAHQSTILTLAAGAYLEWLPQETILFNGALYQQTLRVNLGSEAVWLGWDLVRLGRTARGEQFTTGHWRSHTEIWQGDRLLWVDPQGIDGGSAMMNSPHGLAGASVIASLVFAGRSVPPALVEQVRDLWQTRPPLTQSLLPETGATRLPNGFVCRYRGHSTNEARQWLIQVWQLVRQFHLQRPICIPRVWQLRDMS
ncbi:urease accessory protein UreD [Thermocoleostomius sinensis]|uniref:Urease accessory protein UreD n=1 Tax=Thermocoleostomius sinensis A174 TaxID=2016057 RepID=A0A9E8Z817_9CYAN|nr:urease accessory protein UreD [Thermocoleostomius sinensis]WAL58195.1 urease accessory protein UreD [Thermocoleostomius sinensis A174]